MATNSTGTDVDSGDAAWVLTSSAFVLLMTPGLAFFYGGLVKGTNVLNTMMMCIISMGICTMTWMIVGFTIAFGAEGRFVGDGRYACLENMEGKLWPGTKIPSLLYMAFQMTFVVIGAAIISGSVVERMRFSAYALFIAIWSVVVYAPVCHWVWGSGGWIEELGAKDFAGGTVVHECTAVSALILAKCLGRRDSEQTHADLPDKHNVPFVVLGSSLLWFGWSGFNGGSALAADSSASLALVNTYMAGGASLVTWAICERVHLKRYSATGSVTGAVVGLVVITPAAGFVSPSSAVAMGILGCLLVYPAFRPHCKWAQWADDTLDAFPCHGVGGFVGTMLTGLFAREGGLFYGGGFRLLGVQLLAALATAVYAAALTAFIYYLLSLFMTMRVTKGDMGTDALLHGEVAYDHSPAKAYAEGNSSGSDESTEEA